MNESRVLLKISNFSVSLEPRAHYSPPADVEIPAPATTTIFRLLRNTFSNASTWADCSLVDVEEGSRKSIYSVVRSLGPITLRFLAGGQISSLRRRLRPSCSLPEL